MIHGDTIMMSDTGYDPFRNLQSSTDMIGTSCQFSWQSIGTGPSFQHQAYLPSSTSCNCTFFSKFPSPRELALQHLSGDFLDDSVRSLDSRGWALRRVATAAGGTRGNTGRHGWNDGKGKDGKIYVVKLDP